MSKPMTVPAAVVVLMGVVAVSLVSSQTAMRPAASGPTEPLPSIAAGHGIPLDQALRERRSVRSFTADPLTPEEIGRLLWAAQGITDAAGHRTAPSAGATYPLEVDVVTAEGIARYLPAAHALVHRSAVDARGSLRLAALGQESVADAPAVFVISAVTARTAGRYGEARAQRYVALEAGHAAQNLLLEAVSLGLGAVPIGAFDDEAVRDVLGLADGEAPLYLVPVGHPG